MSFGSAPQQQFQQFTGFASLQMAPGSAPPPPQAMSFGSAPQQQYQQQFHQTTGFASLQMAPSSAAPPPLQAMSFGSAPQQQYQQQFQQIAGFAPPQLQGQGTVVSSDPLEALARLQAFDGCFSLEVLSVIKLKSDIQAVRNAFPAGATDGMVATVLAMAFLSTKLGAGVDRDSWEGIYEKAQQYVEAVLRNIGVAETTDVLEAKIAQMLA
jgi:hypothetical protein